ncbi:3'-5' exonuclease [Streptomyces sp. AV19]|uniref:exonuclease domain-containing protein n=1 Tax=Streptomyces sp. AV19 TaxID=2793068 RepID=UPI0018FE2DF6|nr:exonuclease domain-containing protein [Streptomyces sp. AV19]MBH1939124.1 3'-5' exonuclease [Streptomyces sp. AV19]MDG4535274.1 exonuclease domain-containing protein [Streptomyces sp. AV19]
MTWSAGRLCGFDLETTSPDPETARIVTACVVQVGDKRPTQSRTWLSDVDGEEIPAEAAAIHGVTTDRARAEGSDLRQVVEEVLDALSAVVMAGVPLVVMNARYDLTLLDREARRYGMTPLTEGLGDITVIDPFVIDKQVDKFRRGSRKLADLCAHYRVRLDGAHSADADAIAACRVAWRIAQQQPEIGNASLSILHKQQIEWASSQAESLAAYFARTPGKEHQAATVRREWPLVPFVPTPREGS